MTPTAPRPAHRALLATLPAHLHTQPGYLRGMRKSAPVVARFRSVLLRLLLVTGVLLGIAGMHVLTVQPPATAAPAAAFLATSVPQAHTSTLPESPDPAVVAAAVAPAHLSAVTPPCCTVANDAQAFPEPALPASSVTPDPAAPPHYAASSSRTKIPAAGRGSQTLIPLRI